MYTCTLANQRPGPQALKVLCGKLGETLDASTCCSAAAGHFARCLFLPPTQAAAHTDTHTHLFSPTQLLYIIQTLHVSLHLSAAPDVSAGLHPPSSILPLDPLPSCRSSAHPLPPLALPLLSFTTLHFHPRCSSLILVLPSFLSCTCLLSQHPREKRPNRQPPPSGDTSSVAADLLSESGKTSKRPERSTDQSEGRSQLRAFDWIE